MTGENWLAKLAENGYVLKGEKITPPKAGLYLYGKFMHGDADHYNTSEWVMDYWEELQAILTWFEFLDSMNHNAEISFRQRGWNEEAFYEKVGIGFKDEYLWDGLLDWWPRDITYSDIRAKLEKYWLKYFDGNTWYDIRKET